MSVCGKVGNMRSNRDAKPGMRVTHTSSGKTGIVRSVWRDTINVVFPDGSESTGYASSYHRSDSKGCALLILAGFGGLTAIGALSWVIGM